MARKLLKSSCVVCGCCFTPVTQCNPNLGWKLGWVALHKIKIVEKKFNMYSKNVRIRNGCLILFVQYLSQILTTNLKWGHFHNLRKYGCWKTSIILFLAAWETVSVDTLYLIHQKVESHRLRQKANRRCYASKNEFDSPKKMHIMAKQRIHVSK